MKRFGTIGAGAAALLFAASVAQANHIDLTLDGAFSLNLQPGNISATNTQAADPGNVQGGERFVMLEYAPGGEGGIVEAGILAGDDALYFNNGAYAAGILTLAYGMNSDLNIDFDTDYEFISVDFDFVDGMGDLVLTVTGGGTTGSVSQTVNAAGEYNFFFSDAGFAGVDFFDVDSIEVQLTATTLAADFAISSITAEVPAPGALALLGLAGLTARRRRRA